MLPHFISSSPKTFIAGLFVIFIAVARFVLSKNGADQGTMDLLTLAATTIAGSGLVIAKDADKKDVITTLPATVTVKQGDSLTVNSQDVLLTKTKGEPSTDIKTQ